MIKTAAALEVRCCFLMTHPDVYIQPSRSLTVVRVDYGVPGRAMSCCSCLDFGSGPSLTAQPNNQSKDRMKNVRRPPPIIVKERQGLLAPDRFFVEIEVVSMQDMMYKKRSR